MAYVVERAQAAGYEVSLDEFTYVESFSEGSVPELEETAPEPEIFDAGSRPAYDGHFVSFTGAARWRLSRSGGRPGHSCRHGPEHVDQRV